MRTTWAAGFIGVGAATTGWNGESVMGRGSAPSATRRARTRFAEEEGALRLTERG